jgi:chaperonin cofactor prefoldin
VLDAVKRESEELGVGYQKIINGRLLGVYSIENLIRELGKQIEDLNKRLTRVERDQEKKQA